MSVSEELMALAREVQACDVRLGLLPSFVSDDRNGAFRRELQDRREDAAARLAQLEAEGGWKDGAVASAH